MSTYWYVVQTHIHGERRAVENLARQQFTTWLPLYRKTRRHGGRREVVLRPLFPRYLFVALDLERQRWRPILSTSGVSGLICHDAKPVPVPDGAVDALKTRAADDGIFDLAGPPLAQGDRVRIVTGPFADLEGVVQVETDADRVLVLLKLMGRDVRVRLQGDDVERA